MTGLVNALDGIITKGNNLYAVDIQGIEIVFCLPSMKEVSQYARLLSLTTEISLQSIIYEHIFKTYVVDEYMAHDDNDLPAGIPETISKLIFFLSGADENCYEYRDELAKIYRQQVDNDELYMKRVICQIFPGYTFESLDSLDYQSFFLVFIQAEKVMLERDIIDREHDFNKPTGQVRRGSSIEDIIKKDSAAQKAFDKPEHERPEVMARMRELKRNAIKRAQEEDLRARRGLLR